MNKKYIVRLTDQERDELGERCQEAEGDGPEGAACPDPAQGRRRRPELDRRADRRGVRVSDENGREAPPAARRARVSTRRSTASKREQPPVEKLLDGEQEARIIATRLGPPPQGYANWTLRLLARKVVELEIVESVSYETVRRTLKKTA